MDNFDLRTEGRGTGSRVLSYGDGSQRVALKMVQSVNKKECQLLKNQFMMLKLLKHPHILQAFKLKEIGGQVGKQSLTQFRHPQTVMVAEFASKGSLLTFLLKQSPTLNTLSSLFTHTLQALLFAHSKFIAHRDIKLQNILVFQQCGKITAKLADFGLASLFRENGQEKRFKQVRGSWKYIAPQIWQVAAKKHGDYDAVKTDVFALGVTLFAMLFGKLPFVRATSTDNLYILIIQKNYEKFWGFHGMPSSLQKQSEQTIENFKNLFIKMVSADPVERPSLSEVATHSFLLRQI